MREVRPFPRTNRAVTPRLMGRYTGFSQSKEMPFLHSFLRSYLLMVRKTSAFSVRWM